MLIIVAEMWQKGDFVEVQFLSVKLTRLSDMKVVFFLIKKHCYLSYYFLLPKYGIGFLYKQMAKGDI